MRAFLRKWQHMWKVILVLCAFAFVALYKPTPISVPTTSGGSSFLWWVGVGVGSVVVGGLLVWLVWKYRRFIPPTITLRTHLTWVFPTLLLVVVGVVYSAMSEAWKLQGHSAHIAIGALGLAVALGFMLSSLVWKRWGVWLGVIVLLGALASAVWLMSGATTKGVVGGMQQWNIQRDPNGLAGTMLPDMVSSDFRWLTPYLLALPVTFLWAFYLSDTKELGYRSPHNALVCTGLVFLVLAMIDVRPFLSTLIGALGLGLEEWFMAELPDAQPARTVAVVGWAVCGYLALVGHNLRASALAVLSTFLWVLVQS